MKNITILSICALVFFSPCSRDKKYIVELRGMNSSVYSTGSSNDIILDSVFAEDDISGYRKGAFLYYAHLMTDSLTHYKIESLSGFTVKDASGLNLLAKLPFRSIDSINKIALRTVSGLRARK